MEIKIEIIEQANESINMQKLHDMIWKIDIKHACKCDKIWENPTFLQIPSKLRFCMLYITS